MRDTRSAVKHGQTWLWVGLSLLAGLGLAPLSAQSSDSLSLRRIGTTHSLSGLAWHVRRGFEPADLRGVEYRPGSRAIKEFPLFPNRIFGVPIGDSQNEFTASVKFSLDPDARRQGAALSFPGIGETYQIFLNGLELYSSFPADTQSGKEFSGYRRNLVVPVPGRLLRENNVLVVRMRGYAPATPLSANFHLGLTSSQEIRIGNEQRLRHDADESLQLILYGAYVFFGLYHLLFFAHRPRDRYHLFFGLFSITLSVYLLTFSERAFEISPNFVWQQRIAYPAQPAALGLFLLFLNSFFFSGVRHRTLMGLVTLSNGLFIVAMLTLPYRYLQSLLLGWYLVAAPQLGYVFFVIFSVNRQKLPYARRTTVGMSLGVAFVVWDIVDTVFLNTQIRLTQYAHLLVILSLVTILAQRFLDVHSASEEMNTKLVQQSNAFARFVPAEFLDLLNQRSIMDVKLGDNTERELTILVADIRQFGKLSESMSPAENFHFLNAYLSRVGPLIRRNHGFIDKYIGDAIMALFVSAQDGVQAAIEMRRSLFDYNEQRRESGKAEIDVGIGVHTGRLILGTIGEAERMEGTVISDDVNLAFRLENATKQLGAPVIISVGTLQKLTDPTAYGIRFLGKVFVKHRQEAVSMYELLDGLNETARLQRSALRMDFERALFHYYSDEFAAARVLLESIVNQDPTDRAASFYLQQCQAHEASTGVA